MTRRIAIFDTTLRDGEQSPGASMNAQEKLVIARQLIRLNVDVIEAGFPVSSPEDYRSVCQIAHEVGDRAVVCALSRAVDHDIEVAAEALGQAARPRIHTGLGVSPEHLREKLRITEDEAVGKAVHAVRLARNLCDDVEFYAEDAGRSDPAFLARIVQAVVDAGATVVNIPDTTGYCLPEEFGGRVRYLFEHVDRLGDVTLSVHCHNDLGMATALTLEGVRNGATQVECTINGLGERAGNTAMEEVVMAIRMHGDALDAHTDIDTHEFGRASRTVSSITGIRVQPNKAIVGANAFAHEAGIHQDGMLKNPLTYEIMRPETIGINESRLVLGKHSGRHAFQTKVAELGYELTAEDLNRVFERFKELCDKKKIVSDPDIEAIINDEVYQPVELWRLQHVQVSSGSGLRPTATVRLRGPDGVTREDAAIGTGPVDSVYRAINRIVQVPNVLTEFSIQAVTEGIDAVGEVTIRIEPTAAGTNGHGEEALNPQTGPRARTYSGHGADTDIIVASAKAYMSALNKMLTVRRGE